MIDFPAIIPMMLSTASLAVSVVALRISRPQVAKSHIPTLSGYEPGSAEDLMYHSQINAGRLRKAYGPYDSPGGGVKDPHYEDPLLVPTEFKDVEPGRYAVILTRRPEDNRRVIAMPKPPTPANAVVEIYHKPHPTDIHAFFIHAREVSWPEAFRRD